MTEQELTTRRRRFFYLCGILATIITLVSASATFRINQRSFVDWQWWQDLLAFLATLGIEATFTLALFGIAYALTGKTEKGIGVALLIGTLLVMSTNYIIHHKPNIGAEYSEWQVAYIEWIGPLSLFGILTMIVGIIIFNHEAKERRLDREYAYAAKRKALEWRQEQLESPEFNSYMEQYQPQVFEEARKSLRLPAAPTTSIGFVKGEADNDPKGPGR